MVDIFSFSDLWTFPHENMGNGVSEALKIEFHYTLVCVPKTENHATPLLNLASLRNGFDVKSFQWKTKNLT